MNDQEGNVCEMNRFQITDTKQCWRAAEYMRFTFQLTINLPDTNKGCSLLTSSEDSDKTIVIFNTHDVGASKTNHYTICTPIPRQCPMGFGYVSMNLSPETDTTDMTITDTTETTITDTIVECQQLCGENCVGFEWYEYGDMECRIVLELSYMPVDIKEGWVSCLRDDVMAGRKSWLWTDGSSNDYDNWEAGGPSGWYRSDVMLFNAKRTGHKRTFYDSPRGLDKTSSGMANPGACCGKYEDPVSCNTNIQHQHDCMSETADRVLD